MKDLLYLKDDQIKEFIQLLYYAYRETFSDPREILSKKYFGPAHLRALNLIERNPGINLGELIFKLKITKQSLNRVLRDLIKSKMIKQIQDDNDTRKKNLFLDKEGKILVPVCNSGCGPVEDSQGKDTLVNTKYGQLTKGQANVDLVHTAEIYLTLRSPKEVYATAKPTKIINGEAPHGSNINIPADKYHRETFFVSVHTRNLAKHVAISEQTGTSIGESSSYNK